MGHRRIGIIFLLLAVACFVVIFVFSSQGAVKSDSLSMGIVRRIITEQQWYQQLDYGRQQAAMLKYDEIIRSLAHFCLFMLLAFLLVNCLAFMGKRRAMPIALACCVAYAVFDEMHQQIFAAGRAFQMIDIAKDSAGACIGILFASMLLGIIKKHNKM